MLVNGTIDSGDLEIAMRHFVSNPYNLFWDLNEEAFMRYIDMLPTYGHTNVLLHRTNSIEPVMWAFNIPTGDIEYKELYDCIVPAQLLPADYDVSDYEEYEGDDVHDYIIWIPYFKNWEWLSKDSEYWSFKAGYYVYCLDDNGDPIQKLIE